MKDHITPIKTDKNLTKLKIGYQSGIERNKNVTNKHEA